MDTAQAETVQRLTRSELVLPFVGGERIADSTGDTLDVVNPATGETITRVVRSDDALLDQAV